MFYDPTRKAFFQQDLHGGYQTRAASAQDNIDIVVVQPSFAHRLVQGLGHSPQWLRDHPLEVTPR